MTTSGQDLSQPGPTREKPARAVLFMPRSDLNRFFPEGIPTGGEAVEWVDSERTRDDPRLLPGINPDVLFSAWGTPPLEPQWLASPECRLRYVCHLAGSVRKWVPRSFLENGGVVTNWGSEVATSVAEHALLLALAALRELPRWRVAIETPDETRVAIMPRTRRLTGRRVGVHGFGGIAQRLIALLRPFDVEIRVFSAGVPATVFAGHGVTAAWDLEDLFRGSEVLFECEALTPATKASVTAEILGLLPADAVFVNVGRGRVVDELALTRAANAAKIRVAVDVVSQEPVTAQTPLYGANGVLMSPHIGGPTTEEYAYLGALALRNLSHYRRGEPLEAEVTLEIYDRST